MTDSYFQMESEFADACDIPRGTISGRVDSNSVNLAIRLVDEEWNAETKAALAKHLSNPSLENLVEVADGIGDTIYVLCQLARSLGIPLDSVFLCIHRANMLKVGEDGKVKRREDGKILNPDGWTSPEKAIWEVLKHHTDKEAGY